MGTGHGPELVFTSMAIRCSFGNPLPMSFTHETRYRQVVPTGKTTASLLLMGAQYWSRMSVRGGSRSIIAFVKARSPLENCGWFEAGARSWQAWLAILGAAAKL